jgi:hypothetical protein
MKKAILILCLFPVTLMAQVHIKNQRFLQLNVGSYDNFLPNTTTFSGSLEWGKYSKKLNGSVIGISLNHKKAVGISELDRSNLNFLIPINQYFAYYKTDITLFRDASKVFHIKSTGQVNVGYESINKENRYLNGHLLSNNSEYLLGVGVGLQLEYSPLLIGVTENINFLSKYQKLGTVPYLGLRVHLH